MHEVFQPDLVIHHDADADGRCCAWLMKRYVCPDATFFGLDYGDGLSVDVRGCWVAILDFSFPDDQLEWIAGEAERIILIDHHKPRFEQLSKFPFAVLDDSMSAAKKVQELYGIHRHWAVDYVSVGDRWAWDELPDSKEICALLSSLSEDWEWDILAQSRPSTPPNRFIEHGSWILKHIDAEVSRIAKDFYFEKIGDYVVPTVNSPIYQSQIGHYLAAGVPFAAVWYALPGGTHQYSLRSKINDDEPQAVDVSEVAKLYGGGGHCAAAGFRVQNGKL